MTTDDPTDDQPDTYLRVVLTQRNNEEVIKLVCYGKADGCAMEMFLNEMRSKIKLKSYEAVC